MVGGTGAALLLCSVLLLAPLAPEVVAAAVADDKPCSYVANCDYGHGSRDSAKAASKEECCTLCKAKDGCAAGVLSGGDCWFKTAADVSAGCQHSSRVQYACLVPGAPAPPPGPPPPASCDSAACQALAKSYETTRNATCAKAVAKVPAPNAADLAAFMSVYKAFNGTGDETPVMLAARKVIDAAAIQAYLSGPDSFTAGGLDADLVQCAIMTQATSVGLAEFAVISSQQEALVSKLLADPILMRDMLVGGGAASSQEDKGKDTNGARYGQAMAIYERLQAASPRLRAAIARAGEAAAGEPWDDRSQANILKRLALGTALMHAVPIGLKYRDPECDQAFDWCPAPEDNVNETFVDPVERYLHYETAYHAGDLDPALEVLTAWECRHTTNSPSSSDDLAWVRQTMATYRPEHLVASYDWRYARAVRTDVAYGDPQCATLPGICDGHYAQIPAADGVCGPRAFFGRFTKLAFGIPVWGATQPGHAAMTTWTPTGWSVLLGAGWPFCWWGDRGGPDWVLEAEARENRTLFQQVLRGSWAALANNEPPVSQSWGRGGGGSGGRGTGGPWGALMLYAKKLGTNGTTPAPRDLPTPLVPTKVGALIKRWSTPSPPPAISTGADGTILVPAAAFSSKNHSASITVEKSMFEGEQIMHNGCPSANGPPCDAPLSSSWTYTVPAPAAATYYLTANHSTWHPNQEVSVSVNGAKPIPVLVYYTVGWWNQSLPVPVSLNKGSNSLVFSRSSTRPLVFKEFLLSPKEPNVPKPPGNYTPTPPPPVPPTGDYIEVPASTNCEEQGILPVPAADCGRACDALGFKSTGSRSRPNISGCFVMTTGQYSGNCNYNSNSSATCTPPCTLYGAVVRSLCIRK